MNYNFLEIFILFFGDIAAPFFLMVSGISLNLFIHKKIINETPKGEIFKDVLKRALFIFVVSTSIRIFFGSPIDSQITFIVYWSLFQIISFSMIIFFALPFFRQSLRVFLYISLISCIFLINIIILIYPINFLDQLISYGSFPIIPWLNFFIFGLLFGELFRGSRIITYKILIIFNLIGIILFILWIVWIRFISFLWISTFICSICIFCLLFSLTHYYSDLKSKDNILQRELIRWGRLAFSIYYLHFAIIAAGLIIFPILFKELYMNGFLVYHYLIIIVLFFVGIEIFLILWQKINYIMSFEWMMSKITQKSLISEMSDEF